jgi:AcrR family transcriptional regulator
MEPQPTTERGRATRGRILTAARELVAERGAPAMSLGDVRARAHASQSQLYHYFGDRDGLIQAVVDDTTDAVIGNQIKALAEIETWDGLERWCEAVIAGTEARGNRGGCPVGTLAAALADTNEGARERLETALERWQEAIAAALTRLQNNALLAADTDIDSLATTTLATLQGGLLLAKTRHDSAPLSTALGGALAHLRSHTHAE